MILDNMYCLDPTHTIRSMFSEQYTIATLIYEYKTYLFKRPVLRVKWVFQILSGEPVLSFVSIIVIL